MKYEVIKMFTDGQDNLYPYEVGDKYPRKGYTPTEERIVGLLGTGNKQGVPLIKEVPEEEKPKKKKVSKKKKGE